MRTREDEMAEQYVVALTAPNTGLVRFELARKPDELVQRVQAESPVLVEELGRVAGNWRVMQRVNVRMLEAGERSHGSWWRVSEDVAREALRLAVPGAARGAVAAGTVEVTLRVDRSKFDEGVLASEVQILANMHRLGKPCGIVVTERHRELAEAMGVDIG